MSDFVVRPRGASALPPGLKRLGWMLALPLVDGVFVMLAVAGVLDSIVGIVLVGTMIFGGSGAIAVVLTELTDGSPRRYLPGLGVLGSAVVTVAGVQAALAPTLIAVVDRSVLTPVAVVVLLLIAAQIGSDWFGARSPSIGIVVAIGLLVGFRPEAGMPTLVVDPALGVAGAAAASIGVLIAGSVLVIGCRIRHWLDRDRFRYGGAIGLAVLALALIAPIPPEASLVVLVLAFVFALDRRAIRRRFRGSKADTDYSPDHSAPDG